MFFSINFILPAFCHDRLNIMEISGYSIIHFHVEIISKMSYNPFVPSISSLSLQFKRTFSPFFSPSHAYIHLWRLSIMIERHFSFQLDSIMKKLFTQFDNHPNGVKSNFPSSKNQFSFTPPRPLVTLIAFQFACLLNLDAKFIHLIFLRVMCRESFWFIKFESYTKANFTSRVWNLDWWVFKKFREKVNITQHS